MTTIADAVATDVAANAIGAKTAVALVIVFANLAQGSGEASPLTVTRSRPSTIALVVGICGK